MASERSPIRLLVGAVLMALSFAGLEARDRAVIEGCVQRGIAVATTLGGGYSREFEDLVRIHATTCRLALDAAHDEVRS